MIRFSFPFFRNLPKREKKITVSTLLTISRVILIPFVVGSMMHGHWGMAFFLFISASITDVLDGYLARLFNEKTFLGACLDPVADKMLMISIFATLAFVQTPLFSIPAWFVWTVLAKEMVLIGGAVIVYKIKGHIEVKPTWLGKGTMVAQTVFVTWLFACYFFHWVPVKTYWVMLLGLLFLVLASLVQYVLIGIRSFKLS